MFWNDEESLNGCTAPSEVTRNALMRPRSVTKASVMPSANQEWSVSRDRSASGRTASERIPAILVPGRPLPSQSPGFTSNRVAAAAATSGADHHTLGRRRVGRPGPGGGAGGGGAAGARRDRESTRLNSSHGRISYAAFCLKKTQGLMT